MVLVKNTDCIGTRFGSLMQPLLRLYVLAAEVTSHFTGAARRSHDFI
jgi:hypothetical protein